MEPAARPLDKIVSNLPPLAQAEVRNFVEFLLSKQKKKKAIKLKQNWAGGLRQFRGKFTAMALQKKSLDWRND